MLGFGIGGAAVAAAAVALTVGISQAGGTPACAAVLSAANAGRAQQAGAVSGIATHYVLQGLPNCSYPSPPADGLFVALPPDEYDSAAACGGYLEVHGPDGSVRVEVTDQCPDCAAGHIDLSEAAFSAIAPLNAGLVDVTYQPLANPSLPGPVSLLVKQGSSPYWLALLAANTGNPLASVQVQGGSGGGWHDLVRASYNYWIAQSGAGPGPFTVRLTDTQGHIATLRGIALSPGVVQGTGTLMYGAGGAAAPATEPASTTAAAAPEPASTAPRASAAASTAPPTPRASSRAVSGHGPSSQVTGDPAAGPAAGRQTSSPSASSTCSGGRSSSSVT